MSDNDFTSQSDGSIPNLISLSQIPSNMIQSIETDLLEPVVFNQGSSSQDGFVRFTLQNKGFLHSHSKLFLSVEADSVVSAGTPLSRGSEGNSADIRPPSRPDPLHRFGLHMR